MGISKKTTSPTTQREESTKFKVVIYFFLVEEKKKCQSITAAVHVGKNLPLRIKKTPFNSC
jgi:hypothetical protein